MGKAEIESWISSTATTSDDPGSSAGGLEWRREYVLSDWTRAVELARSHLFSSSTKVRIQFLRNELLVLARHGELTLHQALDVSGLLTQTCSRYIDAPSREAVEAVLLELVRRDEQETHLGVTEKILGFISTEAHRIASSGPSSYAPTSLFVLLDWCCALYTECLDITQEFPSRPSWNVLVGVLALFVGFLLDKSTYTKSALRKSALVRTRRALRSHPEHLSTLMHTLSTAAKGSAGLSVVPLLGISVDVTIRLKNVKDPALSTISEAAKEEIIAIYASSVIMSRTPVPSHISTALSDFIRVSVSEEDLKKTVLPAIEKALLRSPEISLSVVSDFLAAYSGQVEDDVFRKLLTSILNSAKSSNPVVRANASGAFKNLIQKTGRQEDLSAAVADLLTLPKAGKTSGPDHRVALYTMLGYVTPSTTISAGIVQTGLPLLAKETNDTAVSALASSLAPHLLLCLRTDTALTNEDKTVIAREMASSKPAIRRAFCMLVGDALWAIGEINTTEAISFVQALLPAFEANLKTVAANPLSAVAGPLEGYIALAILLGPLSRNDKFAAAIAQNTIIQSVTSVSPKPSFLLWDKVYRKLSAVEDETWLLRAIEAAVPFFEGGLVRNEQSCAMVGLALLHLAVESKIFHVRRSVLVSLERLVSKHPEVVNIIVSTALRQYLTKHIPSKAADVPTEDSEATVSTDNRLPAFLLASVTFEDEVAQDIREKALVNLVVLAHHQVLCHHGRQTWIDMCQRAHVDPHDLVVNHLNVFLQSVFDALDDQSQSYDPELASAGYNAAATLAFVAPDVVLPSILKRLRADLNMHEVSLLTDLDIGIWMTPEDKTYVDVLSTKTTTTTEKKGKGYKDAQWEEEVRKSIASKKAASSGGLSKQDQALVQAQLEKEGRIRQRVKKLKTQLERGLRLVHSLVAAHIEEFRPYLASVATLLRTSAFGKAAVLVDNAAFDIYLELAECCSERLGTMRKWVGVATLRSLEVQGIPEEMQAEPLNSLVIRVLYRLHTLSEQTPFDAPTFSFIYPLLSQVLLKGGIALAEEDDPLEQITLALDIIKFHSAEFSDTAFPRMQVLGDLLHVIKHQPKLAKDASTALVDLGQSIQATATREEIDVLLRGSLAQEAYVRNACLQSLQPFDLTDLDWSEELWIAIHDDDEQNARLARHVWDDNGLDVPDNFLKTLQIYLEHENAYVRASTADALADAVVDLYPQAITEVSSSLQDLYREKAKVLAPEFDEYGMVIANSVDRTDPWPARVAIASAFEALASAFTDADVEPFFHFLITDQALGDRHPDVRRGMLAAGTAVIDLHGAAHLAGLMSMFETHLAQASTASEADDQIQEAVVILFGRLARHLDKSDPRLPTIVERLVEALKTPAEQVQIAVSDCLSPLVEVMQSPVARLIDDLFEQLTSAPKYAARRGAAYGLAGVIKGAGISAIKDFDVIQRLTTATEDKKHFEPRQGAMFAFETFSSTLGRLFEPYVIHILPLLLASFGDATSDVREATHDAARVIMGNLSGYGVKVILPLLLSGLDEKQWRTKKGSIELLGMMAYCAPKQLSQSLPIVIPRLTDVLTDSHAQVRAAANKSLKQFGEVISNPEIQSLVPVFLKAMVDPAKTPNALSALLKTSFAHYIDHSSLALVVPIVERGLRERGAEVKRKAAQIVGNLASLTDSKDFVPYLSTLLPMVHTVLVDPVPEARATAAKSLGTLVERLGEVHFPDLVPGLLRTLKTDTSGVDRQGAAQGLSEVLAGLGMERMEGLLPDIIANAQSPRSTVKEGFMSLLVFLPATFGARFQPHLPKIITPILGGLSDSEDYVREAAMRAGRMIVTNYSNKAIDLLLPELERGMFDSGWRIRQSSITLVGELLFKVSGISGKTEIEEDEEIVGDTALAESSRRALVEVLGVERRDRILSALYLARQDAVNVVRQSSVHIWKALVHNTPRTVREILPELISQIVLLLAGTEADQQETAARTITELCRKSGEKILGEVVTILRSKSTSTDPHTREGVCLTLCEVIESTSDAQREGLEDDIIAMVRASLVDDEANVRSAAAKAFDILQQNIGAKAIDQTIPTLLEALRQPGQSSGTALQALREVMAVRAATVFPVLIPTLTALPMSVFNARALESLVTVAGTALSKRLTVLLNALVKVAESPETKEDEELKSAVQDAIRALFASICDPEGLNTLMLLLLGWAKHETVKRRVSACELFAVFCEESDLDSSLYRVDWIRQLVTLLDDREVSVHTAAWHSFDAFVKSIPKDELEPLVVPLRRTLESIGAPGLYVPGLCLPKGAAPMVPIVIAGLTTGNNEQREQAAYAISDLVERTEESAIKPFVVPFTGPLIRVATQSTSYPPAVKSAIIIALSTMLERIPAFVKPFFPQLQRTFVKSIGDPASMAVRTRAAEALGVLMKNQPRVDPVVTELCTGARSNSDDIASSMVLALSFVVRNAAANVGDKAKDLCIELITDAFKEAHDDHYTQSVAALFSAISTYPELVKPIVETHLLAGTPPSPLASHCILAVLSPDESDDNDQNVFKSLGVLRSVAQKTLESAADSRPSTSRPAREARDILKASDDEALQGLF